MNSDRQESFDSVINEILTTPEEVLKERGELLKAVKGNEQVKFDRYIMGPIVPDSIIRIDEEKAIIEDLKNGHSVTIRGFWRMGKSSMAHSIMNHGFGRQNAIYSSHDLGKKEETIDDFKQRFCRRDVLQYFEDSEDEEGVDHAEKMSASEKTPFEYLNDHLKEKNKTVVLVVDEVVQFANDPDKMAYIRSLKDFSHIRFAAVVHRIPKHDTVFNETFRGFKTHWIKPFSEMDTVRLAAKPHLESGIRFSRKAIESVLDATGGLPMTTLRVLEESIGSYEPEGSAMAVTRSIVEKTVKTKKRDFTNSDHYKQVWELGITPVERDLLSKIAVTEGGLDGNDIDPEMAEALQTYGLIRLITGGKWEINGSLLKKYIRVFRLEVESYDSYWD